MAKAFMSDITRRHAGDYPFAPKVRALMEAERLLLLTEPALVDPAAAIHGEYVPWTTHENWRDCRTRDMRTALAESLAAFLEEV